MGRPLVPGVNVDPVDITAGLRRAAALGYGDRQSRMVLTYALQRHARGEEEGAERTVKGHVDFTCWRVILAAAVAAATPLRERPGQFEAEDEFG